MLGVYPPHIVETVAAMAQLPFVRIEADSYDCWYGVDDLADIEGAVAIGELFARQALELSRKFRNANVIGLIVGDIVKRGKLGPVEARFIAYVTSSAYVGSHN
ncbi:hypothetical protein [Bradyrhizobium liaoningense]|uniref:hypothetical protein n=1 Tax=Bradyrhizobium liaoningense TaxID=43992 RepID=UPI001BAC6D50|nr:hypothetical protein [Bradyrhizobium liaoningense]MBR0901206.1 hypothetical protein [Bradyrhizobium liaoningense]